MPRPRAASLSPISSRTSSLSGSPPPPSSTMSIQHLITTNKSVRYSPYAASRLSCSSSTSGSRSELSEDENTSESDSEICISQRSSLSSYQHTQKVSTPLTARLSRLALSKNLPTLPSRPPAASKRFTHRRTQSLSTPPSYGFILLPQVSKTPTAPTFARRHSELSTPTADTFRIPSPPVPATTNQEASMPLTPTRRATFDRMMLVNPAIAAHLKRGGAVNMRTPDGVKKWRIRLGREAGSLQGVAEEGDRMPTVSAVLAN